MSCAFRRVPCQLARLSRPLSPAVSSSATGSVRMKWTHRTVPSYVSFTTGPVRAFNSSQITRQESGDTKARKLSQKGLDEEEQEVRVRQKQVKRPWLREDADKPPAEQESTNGRTKGKLLTTPTRLLKLILPLPIRVEKDKDNNDTSTGDYGRARSSNDTIQPLALLVHPQQPLSYVERLIQAELPPVVEDGKEKIPNIYFRAEDSATSENRPTTRDEARAADKKETQSTDKNPHVASYSGLGHEAKEDKEETKSWVRWSSSTEMGDFIRDAARGREFAIEVEGYNFEMRVSVPSFNDRTYYMRMRLRRMSRHIDQLATMKKECDELAYKSAHRLAQGGFCLMAGWWGVVYYVTFETEMGWDLVEPVTYLVGLTTIMGGYLWFLYISRDLSYKAAMNVTVSKRQNALYEGKGFDIHRWEQVMQEANALRREIKTIAGEYDVDWDEMKDLSYSKQVKKALENERNKRGTNDDDDEKEEEAEEDEVEAMEEEKRVKSEMVQSDDGGMNNKK